MSAIDTFRRAMRRHEKRARRMRVNLADILRDLRMGTVGLEPDVTRSYVLELRHDAKSYRRKCGKFYRREAFLYSLASDAVARLRVGLAEEARREQEEADAAPFVCPGCYAVGEEECASWCPDASIEREREERDMYGDEEENDDEPFELAMYEGEP